MSLMIKHYTIDGKNCINNNSLVPICNNDNTSTDKETNELKDPGDFRFPDNYRQSPQMQGHTGSP